MSAPDVSPSGASPTEVHLPGVGARGVGPEQAALLAWAAEAHRDLPWRRTRDPWAVLVSEAMLQQTQVARVVPKYHAFLDRFPTPAACAAASQGEVVTHWAGLGYNRRAVQLHRAATAIVTDHAGAVPETLAELLTLPGVGPYTARAVLAFAFEHDAAIVDTNVARVLARRAGRTLRPAEVQAAADAWLPAGAAWAWNQGMLDLGAGRCTPRNPGCATCPVNAGCAWATAGNPDPDPAVGSAGVSGGQSRFEGSDRQGRGRLVDALRRAPVDAVDLAAIMGWPRDEARAGRVAAGLVAEGMVVLEDGRFSLAP